MLTIRKSEERGHANHGWLDSYHTFSFANYYDPQHMAFRALRVINQDQIAGGKGFGTHPHRDMEIITYMLDGSLEHKDSMGNGSIIRVGDVQRMSAGTGITHSEFNPSATETAHLLQIWILPNQQNVTPSYEQISFSREEKLNQLRLIASPDGRDRSVTIHQDANVYASILEDGADVTHAVNPNRYAWIQVARGSVLVGDRLLNAGDAISSDQAGDLKITSQGNAEILVFDLA
ncbi:pirin family protein [Pseudanabaena sp. ABRG5-3]|uniref:pirin family protein n=1 Tax=Pseudanabaena sp. ABRG5-3 TaxID=685565 RepID=UPI000DC71505|nr:pirin family protein [Pseudanabaena sp. ABRG5-3]BBC24789.1 pirin-related protein [Pseudanabaena sp. ABRG5-3]